MDFIFPYRVKAVNLWILSMFNIYRSIVGVVNIVFTASMVLLAVRFWLEVEWYLRVMILLGALFFPVIQPVIIFLRSRMIVNSMPDDMSIAFDKKAMTVSTKEKSSVVTYADLRSVARRSGILILHTRSGQSFILNRELLGDKEDSLYNFLIIQVERDAK